MQIKTLDAYFVTWDDARKLDLAQKNGHYIASTWDRIKRDYRVNRATEYLRIISNRDVVESHQIWYVPR